MNALQFRVWALLQDNLRRAENIDRCRSAEYRALLQREYASTEREIAALRAAEEKNKNPVSIST